MPGWRSVQSRISTWCSHLFFICRGAWGPGRSWYSAVGYRGFLVGSGWSRSVFLEPPNAPSDLVLSSHRSHQSTLHVGDLPPFLFIRCTKFPPRIPVTNYQCVFYCHRWGSCSLVFVGLVIDRLVLSCTNCMSISPGLQNMPAGTLSGAVSA